MSGFEIQPILDKAQIGSYGTVKHSASHVSSRGETLSGFAAFAVTVNYCLGAGFLTLPRQLYETGWAFTMVFGFIYYIGGWLSANYVIDTVNRAGILISYERASGNHRSRPGFEITQADLIAHNIQRHLTARRFEFIDLVNIFFGYKEKMLFLGLSMFAIFANLWLYCIVFTTNVIAVITRATEYDTCYDYDHAHCYWLYKFLIVLFIFIVGTLSLLEIKEQKNYQMLMCFCRLLLMSMMIFVSLYKYEVQGPPKRPMPDTDVEHSHGMISTLALTVGFQMSIPNILCLLKNKRSDVKALYRNTNLIIIPSAYLLAFAVAFGFGEQTQSMSTLSFRYFTWGDDGESHWFSELFVYMIMLFPAVDMLSAFPLWGLAIGNNIINTFFTYRTDEDLEGEANFFCFNLPKHTIRLICILGFVIPPGVLSFFISDIDVTVAFAGLGHNFIVYGVVLALGYKSAKMVNVPNYYKSWFDGAISYWLLLLIAIVSFMASAWNIFEVTRTAQSVFLSAGFLL